MDLDGILAVAGLLLHWRAVLCLLASISAAFLLVHLFPWFTGVQGIVFAALGLLPGVIWEEAARPSPGSASPRSTSTFVAVLAAIIFATTWGAISSTSLHSAIAGMAVFAVAAWGWLHYAVTSKGWLSRQRGALCTVAAAIAYPVAALIAHDVF